VKTLKDIPVNNESFLSKLAGLAPPEEQKGPTSRMPGRKKSRPRGDLPSDLGPVDVESYLNHYNFEFKLKTSGSRRIYRLPYCLFDASHKKNEAAVIQDDSGLLTYQCFHNSCKGRTWHQAKKVISGEDSLAPFCEGYDPDWQPPKKKAPQPLDPEKPFLLVNEKNRATFNPAKMADYLEAKLAPVVYDAQEMELYQYHKRGVWKVLPEIEVNKITQHELGEHAKARWINEAVELLKNQSYRPPKALEFDPLWINLKNGMLHLDTMELVPHTPEFNSRAQLSVEYQEETKCTLWLDTLAEIFADDFKKPDVLQEFFGYCLYPKIIFPAALFQIGQGSNGKYVIERVLCEILGKENVSHISLRRMMKDFGPIEIKDKLLNSCGETETGMLDVTNFKKIATGDEIQAEVKYKSDVKFAPIAKHMVSMNAFPGVKEKTDAFFRRIIVLEYKQKFEGDDVDLHRAERLIKGELNAIFKWAVEGLKRVLEQGRIEVPESVVQAKKRMRAKVNPMLLFVEEMCAVNKGVRSLPSDVFKSYQEWCEDAKIQGLGKQNFYEQIYLNFPDVRKKRYGKKEYFFGIGLLIETTESED